MVRLEQSNRIYHVEGQTIYALRDISLEIGAGEFVAIMGRSGSGKTTLLNMLGRMDRPDTGSYVLEHQEVSAMEDDQLSRVRS